MSDVKVVAGMPQKDGIARPFRTDVQERLRQKPEEVILFTAHASVSIIDKQSGETHAVVVPGTVATAITPLFDPVPPRSECLNAPEKLALYYVLELISLTGSLLEEDGESDCVDALVLRLHEAGSLFSSKDLRKAGLEPSDLIFGEEAEYVNVDCFIGVTDVVKHQRQPRRRYLAGFCKFSTMSRDGRSIRLDQMISFSDTHRDIEPMLRPPQDVLEFWSADYLEPKKVKRIRSLTKKRPFSITDFENKTPISSGTVLAVAEQALDAM